MLALWILLGIAVLIALLLFSPLRIRLRLQEDGVFSYRVRYLFFTLADSAAPKRKKPAQPSATAEKPKKKAPAKASKSVLSFLGLEELASLADAKKAIASKGLAGFFGDIAAAVKRLLGSTARLLRKGVFKHFTLRIVVADKDAADAAFQYGEACAVVYPLITLLSSKMKLRRRTLSLRCDYEAAQSSVFFDGQLQYRPWHFVCYFFSLLGNYLKKERRRNE